MRILLCLSLAISLAHCGVFEKTKARSPTRQTPQNALALDDFDTEYDSTQLVKWIQGPVVGTQKENRLRFTFVRRDGRIPTEVEQFQFWPYMGSMGHGAMYRNRMQITKRAPYIYEANGVVFQMPGKWELEIRAHIEGKFYALSVPVQLTES